MIDINEINNLIRQIFDPTAYMKQRDDWHSS